ncbi:MAG: hemerythrin domain-containing protein [Alphaproteobacteria bacterium]
MPDILQILADDHANMRALMQLLESEVDKMAEGGHADVDTISAVAAYMLEYPDRFHHPVEDLLIQGLQAAGAVPASSVEALETEHARISRLARELHDAAVAVAAEQPMRRDAFVECARRYIVALRRHMDIEDSDFFPRAEESLSAEDRAAIAARLPDLDDPLFGAATRDRYRALGEALLNA